MRENAEAKGRRYLLDGRLTINLVDDEEIRASCRGGGMVYDLGHKDGAWWCTCPARTLCAHLVALQLVTVRAADDDGEAA